MFGRLPVQQQRFIYSPYITYTPLLYLERPAVSATRFNSEVPSKSNEPYSQAHQMSHCTSLTCYRMFHHLTEQKTKQQSSGEMRNAGCTWCLNAQPVYANLLYDHHVIDCIDCVDCIDCIDCIDSVSGAAAGGSGQTLVLSTQKAYVRRSIWCVILAQGHPCLCTCYSTLLDLCTDTPPSWVFPGKRKKLRSSRPIEKELLQASPLHTSVALEVSALQLLA